jgi:DNA end-binding protein Ku
MASAYPAPARGSNLTIGFGLVNVGVKYAPMVDKVKRVSGKYLDPATKGPVTQQYVNEAGKVVEKVTGYPYGEGYVVLEPGDVDALKSQRDGRLELKAYVEPESVELLYFERTYLLWPAKGQEASYDVILELLRESGKYLVGTVVLDKATRVVLLRYGAENEEGQGCLLAQVCTYDANVRWNEHALVTGAVGQRPAPDPNLVSLADQVFEALPDTFDFSSVTDEYDERLRALIQAKATGQELPKAEVSEPAPVVDLMAALKASLEEAKAKPKEEAKPKKAPAKRKPRAKAA